MNAKTYTAARANLAKTMDEVCDQHEPVIVTRQNAKSVVIMSLEDYHSIEETCYLLQSPKNAARLAEGLEEIAHGNVVQKEMKDLLE